MPKSIYVYTCIRINIIITIHLPIVSLIPCPGPLVWNYNIKLDLSLDEFTNVELN